MRQVKKKPMACAIGLSRILREDRATKDGYDSGRDLHFVCTMRRRGAHCPLLHPKGISMNFKAWVLLPAFSSREAKKA